MNEKKFNYVWSLLSKVSDESVLHKTNLEGQNLYHTFAIKGVSADLIIAGKIHKAFNDRGIKFDLADSQGRTALHYAALHNFSYLLKALLESGADVNAQDKKGYTPFSLQLVENGTTLDDKVISTYIRYKVDFKLTFKAKPREDEIEMTALNYLVHSGSSNFEAFRQLLNHGASVNETDEDGYTPLIYAIQRDSEPLVKFFLNYPGLNHKMKDTNGKTPIHHVVSPLEYGSYENEKILELLADHFDVDAVDNQKKAPIYYAYLQDSGVMKKKLVELGAKDNQKSANIKRAATSVIAGASWAKEVDYEEDAESFIEEASKLEKDLPDIEEKVEPDPSCDEVSKNEVVYDAELGPYDLYMTKVDINRGYWGGNVFYKLQVLHHKIRDYYSVLNKYGRIGEPGQTQNTPHPSKEKAIEEFEKIFKLKSGNDWKKKDNFKQVKGKYRLLNFSKQTSHKEYLAPFNLKDPKVPKCGLKEEIKELVNDVTDVKLYQQSMKSFNIDTEVLPLAQLDRKLLNEAQDLLFEIRELLTESDEERGKGLLKSNQKVKYLLIMWNFNKSYSCLTLARKFQKRVAGSMNSFQMRDTKRFQYNLLATHTYLEKRAECLIIY